MRIITRSQWGARPFKRPRSRVPITSRRYVVFHYPGAGTPPKNIRDYAKWIERIHMDENDWSAVGYNFFISHGEVAEGCGRDIVGAHSPPRNRDGIGINIWTSNGVPLPGDLDLARDLYEQLCAQAGRNLTPWWHGRDFPSECPGSYIKSWVQAGMPRSTSKKPQEEDDMPLTEQEMDRIAEKVWAKRWANNDLDAGQRLERAYQNTEPITRGGKRYSLRQAVANIETALLPIRRDGKQVSVRQELADAKTAGLAVLAALVKPTPRMAAPLALAPVPIADVDTDTPTENQEEEG